MPTVQTNDIETYYERRGSGPPVVFVHGALVDHRQWVPQFDALADEYTVVAYDVRGHGQTGGSDRSTYSIDLFADDLAALVDAMEGEKPVVCGLSLGGCIAQVYAERYPDLISGLVLVDTFGPTPRSWTEQLQWELLRVAVPFVKLFGYQRVERGLVWIQERFSRGVSGDYENIEAIRESGPTMSTAEATKVLRALAGFEGTPLGYRSITVPALVLYGEHEAGFVREQSAVLADSIRHASLVEVPDAGHAANMDNPEFVTERLREFLDTVEWENGDDAVQTAVSPV